MRRLAGLLVLVAALRPLPLAAVQLDALDPAHEWKLRTVRFRGTRAVRTADLRHVMATKPRPWFALWRRRPEFDPVAFRTDLDRLVRLYRSLGYYHARVTHDLELPPKGDALTAVIYVDEGPPVYVERVNVTFGGAELPADQRRLLLDHLPIVAGRVFTEEAYNRTHLFLRTYYREHGYARVEVRKQAQLDLERDTATLAYQVDSGPVCVFAKTRVTGTKAVDPEVVRRELAYDPGDPFRQSRLDRTRANLLNLNLFRSVRIDEDRTRDSDVAVRVRVAEAPKHEVRLGVGYDTEEQVRGLASWRDYDFLGGARQLGFSATASFIHRTLTADFLQPHFPGHENRTRLLLTEQEEEEDTFTLDRSRFSPRLEWQASQQITGYAFYRIEYDLLSSVSSAVERALPGAAPSQALLSGFGFGADWNTTDDLLDPTRGWVTGATVEPVGNVLGGDFGFLRLVAEGRAYQRLVAGLLGAGRVRVGTSEPFTGTPEIPLFERFYAGGIDSVRGYGRRRIGPLVKDDPIGGRSLAEASVELRHPITEHLGAAVFLDGGQVSLRSYDLPFSRLRYGTGFGVRYRSPVGPLRLDLGFPLEPPAGDQRWQVHVSLGAAF
jgi:outer membrane protein insertion porin family/translocation and assembly module TamA